MNPIPVPSQGPRHNEQQRWSSQMSGAIITVADISKRYVIGYDSGHSERDTTFREMIARGVDRAARRTLALVRGEPIVQGDRIEEFWALRNINLEIQPGEIVGIIGHNGAGKSTLLKILSRITKPTEGQIVLRGRVASLIEIGTGFHPELTGRENIFLNGALLGMTQREIKAKFDEIVAFAEVGQFLDTPVKRFSSGMYVRLAFAIAAHLEPEILIVDEVLAVGDVEFQRKCLAKMDDAARRQGRTILIVSHNMGAIASLCASTIWLHRGVVRRHGATRQVISDYLALGLPNQDRLVRLEHVAPHKNGAPVRLLTLEWLSDLPLQQGKPIRGRIHLQTRIPLKGAAIEFGFCTPAGTRLLTFEGDGPKAGDAECYSVEFEAESLPLSPDIYRVEISISSRDMDDLDQVCAAFQAQVLPGLKTTRSMNTGVRLASTWAWAVERGRSGPE
jgi:lipopolysaccharide transport system ATP-binding protein